MKKRIILVIAVAALCGFTLSSYDDGPAASGENRTGARGSVTSCGGVGCHGTATGTAVTITVDSGTTTIPVTHYIPGHSYTIKIHGTSMSGNPDFGFQFASVSGTGTTQIQAGVTSALPAHVIVDTLLLSTSGLRFVEHDTILAATSPGVYDVSFQWTAPAAGVGNITFYTTLNAVNGDDIQNAADISGNTSVVLAQQATTAVTATADNITLTAFPNPTINTLSLQLNHALPGTYTLQAFNLNGSCLLCQDIEVTGPIQTTSINTSNWAPGVYHVTLAKEGGYRSIMVVKQ